MFFDIGNQYSLDNPFKKKARLHQSKFRSEILQVDFDEYGNRLNKSSARAGLNFYSGFNIFNSVKIRYPKYSKGLYADMLRSEHIPFNIFIPMQSDLKLAQKVFSNIIHNKIKDIIEIKIEYAPRPAKYYLNDRTAFDTFIKYENYQNEIGIIGIEVKYTEHEYKLKPNSKEEKDILNPNSIYYQLTNEIELYRPEKIIELKKDNYRQFWRNQLLGESMIIKSESNYFEFTSLVLFPSGNKHFLKVTSEYKDFINGDKNNRFVAITYESFFKLIETCTKLDKFQDWISYLKSRYLFN